MNFSKNLALWIIIALLLVALFNLFQGTQPPEKQTSMAYSDFVSEVKSDRVSQVTMKGNSIKGKLTTGREFSTYAPEGSGVVDLLSKHNVRIKAKPSDDSVPGLWGILISWFPFLLLIGVWIFFMRQMQGGGNGKAMGFGKSKAKMLTEKTGYVSFDDVAGVDEAKQDLEEVVDFLKDPQRFQRVGGEIPKGLLVVGPPGTGKTLLARAIAGEANVPFFTISGSDFVEMFVGVGASRVRDMFEQGKKNAPCIIFIDEIDAVGRNRGAGMGGGNDEREQTLNQLLAEMDGFETNEGVILVAATNRPDVLDPALLRPGRFDRQIVVPNPDVLGREQILKVHMQNVPQAPDVEPRTIARGTPGFSGADLKNLVNEAALLAARRGKRVVAMDDFEAAKDKVMMGAERRSMVMSDDEKKLTAYHEAGHTICALYSPESDPIHKATIIPRGRALGVTMRLPEADRISTSRAKLYADLTVAMGGRIAEEMIFGVDKITTGASNDIKQATDVARSMVCEWGMSDTLGPLAYGGDEQETILGPAKKQHISEETAREVDKEVRAIVDYAYNHAREILTRHFEELKAVAEGLREYETLSRDDIDDLLAGRPPQRPGVDEDDEGDARQRERGRRASVPTAGAPARGGSGDVGPAPDPQPGS